MDGVMFRHSFSMAGFNHPTPPWVQQHVSSSEGDEGSA